MPPEVTPRRLAGVLRRPLRAVMQTLSDMGVDVRDPDELLDPATVDALTNGRRPPERSRANTVFIVHGHDERRLRETLALFLTSLDLRPLVLDREPNRGQVIIEKLEKHSEAAFAVVLLTGDDEGRKRARPRPPLQLRARQNVILELGYFMARLGRERVCALYEPGVELPSDYAGVLWIPIDARWEYHLQRELLAAGLPVRFR